VRKFTGHQAPQTARAALSGPSTARQPMFETRLTGGLIQVGPA
jgi:hypothetical protein